MKSSMLQKIGFAILIGTTFILPLFFLPITSEFYEYNKQYLLIISSTVLLLIWAVSSVLERKVRIIRNPFTLPLLAIVASWIVSTIAQTPNRTEALIDPGNTGTIVALCIYFFSSVDLVRTKKQLDLLLNTTLASFSLLSVLTILWNTGLMGKILPWAAFQNPLWSPSANPLSTFTLLIVLLPLLAVFIVKQKENSSKTLGLSIAALLFIVASGMIAYRVFRIPANRPIFLPQSTSWSIAMESLKISPLLGTGPGTYLMDFTRFRPVSYNLTQNWAVRFTSSSNFYLQTLATVGLLGLLAISFLVIKVASLLAKVAKSSSESALHIPALSSLISALLILVSMFFLPPTITAYFLLFTLMIVTVAALKLTGSSMVHEANIDIVAASESGVRTPILPWVFLVLSLALAIPGSIVFAKAYYAEILFQKALTAAAQNQGKNTYDLIYAAIRANNLKDSYRVAASQTNLLLANSAASKKDLTAEERNTITQLVQQAIREAKNAVTLNPTKVTNVENLAGIYQNLLNFAQGADEWSVASYRQAVLLDPTNPNLRISLGGIFYARKNYDEAIRLFQQAADLKPNYANAYYNMSAAYKEKKDYQNAYLAMQNVVNLIDKTTPDFLKAQGELEDLSKLIGAQTAVPSQPVKSELEAPKALPSPKVNPPLNLPSDLGPQVTTTPAPQASPAPTAVPAP